MFEQEQKKKGEREKQERKEAKAKRIEPRLLPPQTLNASGSCLATGVLIPSSSS